MTKIRKTKIRTVTKTKDTGYISKKLKIKYAGYIIRNHEERWKQRTHSVDCTWQKNVK